MPATRFSWSDPAIATAPDARRLLSHPSHPVPAVDVLQDSKEGPAPHADGDGYDALTARVRARLWSLVDRGGGVPPEPIGALTDDIVSDVVDFVLTWLGERPDDTTGRTVPSPAMASAAPSLVPPRLPGTGDPSADAPADVSPVLAPTDAIDTRVAPPEPPTVTRAAPQVAASAAA